MEKLEPIGIRFADKERSALAKAAEADDRPLSSMARKLVVEALRKAGWLK